jgi:hypothetical protein
LVSEAATAQPMSTIAGQARFNCVVSSINDGSGVAGQCNPVAVDTRCPSFRSSECPVFLREGRTLYSRRNRFKPPARVVVS